MIKKIIHNKYFFTLKKIWFRPRQGTGAMAWCFLLFLFVLLIRSFLLFYYLRNNNDNFSYYFFLKIFWLFFKYFPKFLIYIGDHFKSNIALFFPLFIFFCFFICSVDYMIFMILLFMQIYIDFKFIYFI